MNEDMKQTFETLEKISQLSGRNDKTALLMTLKNNEFCKFYLETVFHPYLTYGVSDIPKLNGASKYIASDLIFLKTEREMLALRQKTGDAARNSLACIVDSDDPLYNKWIRMMWQRELRIGVSTSTIDKVFPGLIPSFEVALCTPISSENLDYRWVSSRKLNGFRCIFTFDGDKRYAQSRNGKELFNVQHILDELAPFMKDCVLDGELMSFVLKNSWNSTASIARASKSKREASLGFNLIYKMPVEEWKARKCIKILRETLKDIDDTVPKDLKYTRILDNYPLIDTNDAWRLAAQFLEEGYEGAVVKNLDSVYDFDRSDNWLKMKFVNDIDLEVIDLQEGQGRNSGRLGALICKLPDGGTVNVGSGFSDIQRDEFWGNRNMILGKTIEIKYQERTKDGSLLFPVFKLIRTDK